MEPDTHNRAGRADEGRPVAEEFRTAVVEPFRAAVCQALREGAATEAALRTVYRQAGPGAVGEISAVLPFWPPGGGGMVLSCPRATAAALAGRILAGFAQGPDQGLIQDSLGELANVIAGQAKAMLTGTPYHFAFATPAVVCGVGYDVGPRAGTDCVVLVFDSDAGSLALQLFVEG